MTGVGMWDLEVAGLRNAGCGRVGLAAMTGMLGNTMAGVMTTGMAGMAGIAMRMAMPEGMSGNDGDGKFETLWRGVMVVMGGGMEMDDDLAIRVIW